MATNTLGNLIINVEANTKHLVDGFNRAEQKVNSATSSMKTSIKSLVGAYASLQAVDVAKFYATQIDALTSANNRLKLVTASQKEFNATQQELFQIAQSTRQSFTTTIELHARLGLATKDLSKSQKELLPITDAINKAMIISGGTAQAQAAALVQLGQAFSADFKAVGQELGSLREQAPRLYTALVDGMGVSREAFKKMAEDGSLSSEKIIAALQRQAFALNQEFATMTLTIEQSVTVAQNALQKFIGEFDKATGVSKAVSDGIRDTATALDELSPEQIAQLTNHIQNAAMAIAGTVATITAAKVAYSGYSSVVQKMNAYSDATSKLEMAKAKALNLSERASIAKALADEALNTKTAAGIALTDKQIAGLNNQAIHLDKAAKKAEFAAIQQSKYTKSLSLGATALRTFGSILTTIPITIAITALTSLATSFFNANKDAEIFNETLSKTKDELNKLSKAQVAYNLSLGDQKLGEQLEERRKLALELKREQQGLFTGTALADKNAKPKENQETKRLQAELDAIDAGIKATRETVLNLKNLQDERKKALEVSAPKEDPEVERINKKYDALLKAEVEGSAKYQELLKQKNVEMQTYYYDPKADLAVAKKVTDPLGAKIDEINKKYDEHIAKIKDLGAKGKQAADEYNKARNIEIKEAKESANKKGDKAEYEELKKSHKLAQDQLKMLQEESDKKIKLQEDYENTILSIAQKGSEDRLSGLAKEALEEYNHYDLLIEKYAEVDEAWETFSRMQLQAMDDIIAKQKELDEAHDNKAAIDSLDEIYGRYEKLIDAQIELAENGMNIDFDFGDGAKELNNISKAMQQLHVGSLKYTKQDMKLQEDYAKAYLEAGDDTQKQAQLKADFDADNAALNKTRQTAEIAGYANLAGAIAGAFEEGSGAAKAFQAIQATLGIVNAYTSISQAMALPYPANIPATAAAVAAAMPLIGTLVSLGGSGGSGGGAVASPAIQATGSVDVNNAGTVLGDTSEQSESMKNSLELLEDLAKPEFALFSEMAKSLQSIDSKLGGLASLVIRNEEFALGEGFQGSSNLTSSASIVKALSPTTYTADLFNITGDLLKDIPLVGDLFSNIGMGLDKLTNSIMGGLFGKTTVSLTDYGIAFNKQLITEAIDAIDAASYQKIETKKKSWFGSSTSTHKVYKDLNNETERQFELVLSSLYDTVVLSGQALDVAAGSVENELSDFVVNMGKISFKGKTGDKIQKELTAVFNEVADELALEAFPAMVDFQQIGEGLFETLTRVSVGMEQAEYYTKKLGAGFEEIDYLDIEAKDGDVALEALRQTLINFEDSSVDVGTGISDIVDVFTGSVDELYETYDALSDLRITLGAIGDDAIGLTSSMLFGADGISSLDDALSSFIDGFLSESEQISTQTTLMNEEFEKIGLTMPSTRDEFVALVDGIDTTSEAGQELYGRVIILSDGFNELQNTLDASRENIKSFIDSLKTSDQLAADMASTLGVSLATSVEGLASLFNQLAYDLDGLTDAELDLINANKALLENTDEYQTQIDDLNITLDDASRAIGTLDGALGTIQSTIEKLRATSRTSEQSLQIYYDAIAEAQRLSTTDLYDDFAKAVSKASAATNALFETSNFQSSRDMQFAQLVAANQFEGLADITLEEIDYLKQIEVNTRTQIDVLVAAMNSLGTNVSSSLSSAISTIGTAKTSPNATASYIQDIYSKYDLHQYQTDTSGYAYWEQQVSSGAVKVENLDSAIKAAAEGVLGVSLPSFAVGTPNVPYDMLANIHKGEMIVPATYNQGIQQGDIIMGDTSGIVGRMDKLISRIEALEETNSRHLARIEYNTTKSRTEGVA